MNNTKTFRLFISSTFSDFSKEREVLQTSVFPQIREYASSKGYTFQPIDLRWGVSNKAQLDQKTLELCLEEVRSCKTYPHPNFLIMIGDRYGWVPLPYCIEESEFEQIYNHIVDNDKAIEIKYKGIVPREMWYDKDEKIGLKTLLEASIYDYTINEIVTIVDSEDNNKEKIKFSVQGKCLSSELLNQWYEKDLNQIPPSYILKERRNEFEVYEIWVEEEKKIRELLQTTVKELKFDSNKKKNDNLKRKYFLSATELEVEERIFPYLNLTEYQRKLRDKDKTLELIDAKHVFGFIRNLDKNTQKSDMFIDDNADYKRAQDFKEKIVAVLEKKLELPVTQKDNKTLDEEYLERFKKEVTQFIIDQINEQIKKEDEQKKLIVKKEDEQAKDRLLKLKAECDAQKYFAKQKRKNFIKTTDLKKLRTKICTYIDGNTRKPMIIHGPSGSGKSAFMANTIKLVERLICFDNKKLIYRFIGATPYTSHSREMLLSIFDELSINMRSEADKQIDITERTLNHLDKNETFEEFSDRTYDEIMKIDEKVVLFIDAVDQLTNTDQFRWLPSKLPSNIKIIISALDDKKYKKESDYFRTLKHDRKINNIHSIQEFNEPENLLTSLLKMDNRTIQPDQMNYFIKQYESVKSPLYITIAAEEMKHWKSYDYVEENSNYNIGKKQSLSNTQKGIIEEFIENLSKIYHHDKRFVHKVLGYLYASKDGLSESELLQLISTDEVFIKQMAPETWHSNTTKELPLVLWTRLYSQLKPFLSVKEQDGGELLYFFHREFEDVVSKYETKYNDLIIKQQDEHENLIKSTQVLITKYENEDFNKKRWGKLYIRLLEQYNVLYNDTNNFQKHLRFILDLNESWIKKLLIYINDVGFKYQRNLEYETSNIYENFFMYITEKLYEKNKKSWFNDYISALMFSSINNQSIEMIGLMDKAESILKLHKDEISIEEYDQLMVMILDRKSYGYSQYTKFSGDAVKLSGKAIEICVSNYEKENDINYWLLRLLDVVINISSAYEKSLGDDTQLNIKLMRGSSESIKSTLEILYDENIKIDSIHECMALNSLAESYTKLYECEGKKNNKVLNDAILNFEKALTLARKLYSEKPISSLSTLINILKNLAHAYSLSADYSNEKAIKLLEEAKEKGEGGYEEFQNNYAILYTDILNNLGDMYTFVDKPFKAIPILEEAASICSKHGLTEDLKLINNTLFAANMKKEISFPHESKIGRNDHCPCGSGKKYKKCCGKNK